MTDIAIGLIKPNPYRDFDLHPLDDVQVERLRASIHADGFWASVVARRVGGDYQVAFGHHRIEAARAEGLTHVPLEVRELTDWQMVRMLASENATQRGSTAAACLDAVAAISKVLAYNLLRWENEARFVRNLTIIGLNYPECRGRLEAGSGIGHDCVMAFAPAGAFSRTQIDAAIGTLKDSGRMADIIANARVDAEAGLLAEQQEAERAVREAEDREAAAQTKREREAASKATRKAKGAAEKKKKATAAAGKAVDAAKRQPVTYDARCAQLFKLDSHAQTFRSVVTGETFQSYLPLHAQFDFAKAVLETIRANKPGNREITAADIRAECWTRIQTGLGMPKSQLRTAPERPFLQELVDGLNFIRRAASDYRRGVALVVSAQRKGQQLDAKQLTQLAKLHAQFEDGMAALKPTQDASKPRLITGEGEGI